LFFAIRGKQFILQNLNDNRQPFGVSLLNGENKKKLKIYWKKFDILKKCAMLWVEQVKTKRKELENGF
jgi:hypothetical protein